MQITAAFVGRSLRRGLVVSTFLLAVGCGSKGTVSGKVTYKDKPLTGGQVTLFTEKGRAYVGGIKEDGTYTVEKVPAGPVKISVVGKEQPKMGVGGGPQRGPGGRAGGGPPKDVKFGPPKDSSIPDEARKGFDSLGKPDPTVVTLPAKYKDAETSELTLNVTGGSQTYDIPLK